MKRGTGLLSLHQAFELKLYEQVYSTNRSKLYEQNSLFFFNGSAKKGSRVFECLIIEQGADKDSALSDATLWGPDLRLFLHSLIHSLLLA